MTIYETAKKSRSTLEVFVGLIIAVIYLNNWFIDLVVDQVAEKVKTEMVTTAEFKRAFEEQKRRSLMSTNDIQLKIVESDLRNYQRTGLDNLSEQEKFIYEVLVKTQEKLTDDRNKLLGLTE